MSSALRSPASSKKRRVSSNILLFVVFQPSHRKVERSVSRVHGGFVGGVQGVGLATLLLVHCRLMRKRQALVSAAMMGPEMRARARVGR